MEFDINIILVPVTLVFLLAYLADKFFLKQHKLVAEYRRLTADADVRLKVAREEFSEILQRFGHHESPDEFVAKEHTPQMLTNAHIVYQEAKRSLLHARGGVESIPPKELFVVRWAYEYLPILLVIILVRSFVAEPFNIPSSSMVPTLYTGDFIIVNKSAYGLRLPITHTKILNTGEPKHGDVVVFRYPLNEKRYYIKRMIGVSGDTVSFDGDRLSVNGKPIDIKASDYAMPDRLQDNLAPQGMPNRREAGHVEETYAHYYQETQGAHQHNVRYVGDVRSQLIKEASFLQQHGKVDNNTGAWQITVPEGNYFVMGDNRDSSEDSRFWGFVPEENLAGRASYIWMHKDAGLSMPSFGRAGKID